MKQMVISYLDDLRRRVEEHPAAFSAIWVLDHVRQFVELVEESDEAVEESDEAVKDEHTAAAIAVLKKRADVCREVIKQRIETKKHYDVSFFAGQREGYEQAVDLLKEPTESIRIEL